MIELYNVNSEMEELQSYTKCRKAEICGLYQDDDRSCREVCELIFDRFDLWIDGFFLISPKLEMMIESDSLVFSDIM